MLHLLLSRWTLTLTLSVDYLFPRRLEAQNVVVSVAASKLETQDLFGICYCLFPHGPEVQNVGDLLQSFP